MNRFKISVVDYKKNEDAVISLIMGLGYMSQTVHLVIDGLQPEDESSVKDNPKYIEFNDRIKLYSKVAILGNTSEYDTLTYVNGLEDGVTKQEFIDIFYKTRIDGYRGTKLLMNTLYDLRITENNTIVVSVNGRDVADNTVGIYNDFNMYEDRFISVNGMCKKCRNPMCDMMDEAKIIPFMVNHKSCIKYKDLINKVSEEVHEVKREEFVYLMEVLFDMRDATELTANKVLEHLMKAENKAK